MAYNCPKDLDGFMPHLPKADTKFRQQLGADLLAFLAEPSNSIVCQDIGQLVDGLIPWMQSSNYKVSSNGIEVMTYLVDRLGHDFRPYLQTVLPAVVDRLGDAKDAVREKAQLLILKLLEREVLTPQTLLEKLTPGFTHKNAKIREEVLRCLVNTLNEHGAQTVTLNKFIPHIVKLLSDPTSTVRDTAFSTLVDLYKHVGEKLRIDIQKKNLVPAARLPTLLARFDEVKDAGELLPTASTSLELYVDKVDKPAVPSKKGLTMKRIVSAAPRIAMTSQAAVNTAGAVDEETFQKAFEDVPKIQLFSPREVSDHMKNIFDTISDVNKDWNKRVDALKKLRSLVIAGATNFEDFYTSLRQLEIPLQTSVKDLRSQVVRECCITIAYLAQTLKNKFEHGAECLLNNLINLIQNSAKIIATAGLVCVRFIIQYCHNSRLIPIITSNLSNSKSKDIRRSCCEFLEQVLMQWPTHPLERHIAILQDAVKKGVADADPDARISARKAFRGFRDHFPEQAEALLQSLEPAYRRALQGELCLSSSSSSGSLAQTGASIRVQRRYRTPTASQSNAGSTENLQYTGLQRAPSLPRNYRQRSGIPVLSNSGKKGFRSNSAIDLQAQQRAKARAQYAAIARHKVMTGSASLQGEVAQQARPRKTPETPMVESPERLGRRRSRSAGISYSQPTSRSGSPNSRLPYVYGSRYAGTDSTDSPRSKKVSSRIPRSTTGSRDTSREASPTRIPNIRYRRSNDRPPISPSTRPVMAQKILQQSREAENALADALTLDQVSTNEYHRLHLAEKSMRSLDNHSDDSETSSVCSERSCDSYRRPSGSFSWSGSQQRLPSREMWEPCRDIIEIISLCASTVWQERKNGLVSLRYFLNSGAQLSPGELRHITEIFTRMFMDSHTKGLSVFLDTLNEVIKRYKHELLDWLYVLLQRIFQKLGSDLLNSTHGQLLNTLDIIRKNYPVSLQLTSVYRFLVDATQTPNSKTKTAALNYLTSLCQIIEHGQFVAKPPASQALQKIITYAQDTKSMELRNAAKVCIVALWNCNTPQVTMMLAELTKEQQDIASTVVNTHMQQSSTGSDAGSVPNSPKALSPNTPPKNDVLNQEEIYRSLRKTTAEIQNYSYETLGSKLDRNKVTTSHDSGISQMSVGNDVKNDVSGLEERMEELTIRSNYTPVSGTVNGVVESDLNGYNSLVDGELVVSKVLENCIVDNPTSISEKHAYLLNLTSLIKMGHIEHVIKNFKKLLRLLIDNLNTKDAATQIIVLQIFTEIFNNPDMKDHWSNFVELLTLRILSVHCEEKVYKMVETTAAAMRVFPFHAVISVLTPLIQTGTYHTLQGAIKMLTKLIEEQPNEVTDEILTLIMPDLIKANDHEESSVRKSSVFCMVALHQAVGEERLSPHIANLAGSKLKLLRLYISRAQASSNPTSPKNSGTS